MEAMSAEAMRALITNWVEEMFNQGKLENAENFIGPEFINHNAFAGQVPGPAGVRALIGTFRGAFPDLHGTLNKLIVEGDMAATNLTMTGTHTGTEFMGIPATGAKVSVSGMGMYRLAGGLIREAWVLFDGASLAAQVTGNAAANQVKVVADAG